jgi:1-acyl-sn-glycerol-3-phosphate acyltransferase
MLVFAVSFLIVIPLYFLIFNIASKEKAPKIAHRLSRFWAGFLFTFFFIRLKVRNKELIDPNRNYVFVGNHLSQLDIPAYALSCNNTFRFLAKAELAKIPLLGYVIKNLYITVNRTDKADRHKSLDKMIGTLREGYSVFLCPEGTRNKTGDHLLEFKDGAFRLAIAAKIPLAVLTLKNTNALLSPTQMIAIRPGIIDACWSEPIDTSAMTEEDVPRLKEMARQQMISFLESKMN